MDEAQLPALTHQVLWASFGLALLFGALCQRTRFCTMGAIADVYTMGDWRRAHMWMLATAVATLGFQTLAWQGQLNPSDSIYLGSRVLWLSGLLGGLMFGFGMVLSSGCVSRNLVRLGAGNLKSLVVLLVAAVAAGATLRGLTAVLRVATVEKVVLDLPGGQSLPQLMVHLTNAPRSAEPAWTLACVLLVVLGLAGGVLSRPGGRSREVWWAGAGVGLLVGAWWWVSGHLGFLPEDPRTLEPVYLATNSRHMESLSTIAPIAYALDWLLMFSDQSKTLTLGIVSVAGIVLGSGAMALIERSFRWEGFGDVGDLALHLAGAVCMGVGGIVAMGCTIGQGITGLSTLSLGSAIALVGMLAGAWLGLRYQEWRLERM